ncbi:MAG: tetratricopeptide repeat protein [Candidatus Methylomirabilales bacterium]
MWFKWFTWFKRHKSYDRFALLAAAEKARAKGKVRKAITAYRKVLEVDPSDHETHGKLAPLLAERRQLAEAWKSFVVAGEGYLRDMHEDKALSIYMQAARYLPHQIEVWKSIARLQVGRGRPPDAVKALLDGSRHFRRRNDRSQAIRLLRLAGEIEPWHFEATYTLARMLIKVGERREAWQLLESLAERVKGRNRRRACATLFRMSPSFVGAWRWVRAAIAAREIPFPRRSSWLSPAIRQHRRGQAARKLCLVMALIGMIVVGISVGVDVGPQTYYVLLVGSGLTAVGLASLLLF